MMKIKAVSLAVFTALCMATQGCSDSKNKLRPHLSKQGTATQLHVDGEPFLMIAGELHNSSATTLEYMQPIFPKIKSMNVNTVLAAIAWEQFEPVEGIYDYTLIDAMIQQSRENGLKLVVLWFASWKNGQSSYAPIWVKEDTDRFWRVKTKSGDLIETLSPFCEATRTADARAYAALLKRIKEVDTENTIIMMQPQNEVGMFASMDYNKAAMEALKSEVPAILIEYLVANQELLQDYLKNVWEPRGSKTRGNWLEVFGDTPAAREFLLAWQYATYINSVANAGKEVYSLPSFVNAWLVQEESDLPGVYPNGGPVSRVMDVWKAAAPNIFTLCPDIYLPNFKEICAQYAVKNNPLLIPETTVHAGRAFYAFAEHDAIGFAPFGFEERAANDFHFQAAYSVLKNELAPIILKYQGTGKMHGILRDFDHEVSQQFAMGRYKVEAFYTSQNQPCYGLIIQTAEHEFLVAGVNLRIEFSSINSEQVGYISQVCEGRFEDTQWIPTRMLNGDETFHHSAVRVFGRKARFGTAAGKHKNLGPQPEAGQEHGSLESQNASMPTPAIYKIITYLRD